MGTVQNCTLCDPKFAIIKHHSNYMGEAIMQGFSLITHNYCYHAGNHQARTLAGIRERIKAGAGAKPSTYRHR